MRRRTKDLLDELADAQARLAELDRDREEALARISTLKALLAATSEAASPQGGSPEPPPSPSRPGESHPELGSDGSSAVVPTSPYNKVRLFRSLFRG